MMAQTNHASTTSTSDSNNNNDPAVQVFVRVRPLITEEEGHDLLEYKTNEGGGVFQLKMPTRNNDEPKKNPAFSNAPPLRRRRDEWKTYQGFTNILQEEYNNEQVYQATIQPLVQHLAESTHQSACVFTYGHTGSGKVGMISHNVGSFCTVVFLILMPSGLFIHFCLLGSPSKLAKESYPPGLR